MACKLVRREYDRDSLRKLEKMERVLKRFLKNYNAKEVGELYGNLCEGRKVFVTPVESTDEMYVEKWMEEHLGEQNPFPEQGKYETEQGEYVRSKSEKILADTFYKMKVPYRYEAQLNLGCDIIYTTSYLCDN